MELKPVLIAALLLAGPLLSACGYKAPVTRLQPPDPNLTREEQQQAREAERRRVSQGLTVAADTRPLRVDDLTVKLEERRDDPFSLPPEGTVTAREVPFPGEEVEERRGPLHAPSSAAARPAPKAAPQPAPQPIPEQ